MDADSYLKVEKAVLHSWAARGFCERVLNSCICQDCDVKTSKVTLTFHYLFFHLDLLHQCTKFYLQSTLGSFTKESP